MSTILVLLYARSAYNHIVTNPVTNITKCLQRSNPVSLSISYIHSPHSTISHRPSPIRLTDLASSPGVVTPGTSRLSPSMAELPYPVAASLVSGREGSHYEVMTAIEPMMTAAPTGTSLRCRYIIRQSPGARAPPNANAPGWYIGTSFRCRYMSRQSPDARAPPNANTPAWCIVRKSSSKYESFERESPAKCEYP